MNYLAILRDTFKDLIQHLFLGSTLAMKITTQTNIFLRLLTNYNGAVTVTQPQQPLRITTLLIAEKFTKPCTAQFLLKTNISLFAESKITILQFKIMSFFENAFLNFYLFFIHETFLKALHKVPNKRNYQNCLTTSTNSSDFLFYFKGTTLDR